MTRYYHTILYGAAAVFGLALCYSTRAVSLPSGIEVGVATYTFRHLTVMEAIEKTKECGGDVVEFFLWQNLSPEHPNVILNPDLPDEHIAAVKAKLKATGVKAVNAYFNNAPFEDKAHAEAKLRKLFEFARKLGLRGLTGEPPADQLDLVEKMVKEYEHTTDHLLDDVKDCIAFTRSHLTTLSRPATATVAADYCIAANGDDANPGTAKKPSAMEPDTLECRK